MVPRLEIEQAVQVLRQGGIIAFPTETSFGFGCRAFDATAVGRIVRAKGRPDGKPLPVLLPGAEYLRGHGMETPLMVLAEAFWPGPLTLVVPAFPGLPAEVTGSTNMVGVRVSAHPVARALVEALGEPIVGTSANRTGQPAASSVEDCDNAGLTDIDGLVVGEPVAGSASTVVGLVDGDLLIHRQGPVTETQLRSVWSAAGRGD